MLDPHFEQKVRVAMLLSLISEMGPVNARDAFGTPIQAMKGAPEVRWQVLQ